MCKFLTHYIHIKYCYHNIYWSETPVRPPAIKNATLFTRTHQGTSLHFAENQLDPFVEMHILYNYHYFCL